MFGDWEQGELRGMRGRQVWVQEEKARNVELEGRPISSLKNL